MLIIFRPTEFLFAQKKIVKIQSIHNEICFVLFMDHPFSMVTADVYEFYFIINRIFPLRLSVQKNANLSVITKRMFSFIENKKRI